MEISTRILQRSMVLSKTIPGCLRAIPLLSPQPGGIMMAEATLDELVAALKLKAIDRFSRWAIEGAQHALTDSQNRLRLNFFSTAMRILFEHVMDALSPEEQVVSAPWFQPERPNGKPTRWQRAIFAVQGGLTEAFVKDELKVDLPPLRQHLLHTVDELSKHVHGRRNTIVRDVGEQDIIVRTTIAAMSAFLDALHDCRAAVLMPIAEALDEAAIDALLSETLLEVDELASHYSLDNVDVEAVTVRRIGSASVTYRVIGSVEVTLQWGSNSDVERGDGAELEQSFPFWCEFELPLDDLWDLDLAEPTYGVDTSEWTDAMKPDECDDKF
jgi:hypothetical protein